MRSSDAQARLNPIPDLLDDLHADLLMRTDGQVSAYIPELTQADPNWFGLALATLDGHVYESGDAGLPFTIQSVSKPFVYALALAERGLDEVLARVGVQPTGDAFNSISLEEGTGRPWNPMINAGAILTTSLVAGASREERFAHILQGLSCFAGRELSVNEQVYAAELAIGDRNRALAYLMRDAGSLHDDVQDTVAVYFRQCAVEVTTRDLAIMSATLANAGTNPITGKEAIDPDSAAYVLTVMATCGMYGNAGEWLLRVGIPAKSGITGAIAAALPAQLGIGLFSPPLDIHGNSVRSIAACQELSARLDLHLVRPPIHSAPAVYLSTTAATMRSSQIRPAHQRDRLSRFGSAIVIRGIQGDVGFAAAERIIRDLADTTDIRWLVLDLHLVGRLYPVAARLLDTVAARLAQRGIATVIADPAIRRLISADSSARHPTLDLALRWCEDQLLRYPSRG